MHNENETGVNAPLESQGPLPGVAAVTAGSDFATELKQLINRHSKENGSNTPDFILAKYLDCCLSLFNSVTNEREAWYGRNPNTAICHGGAQP